MISLPLPPETEQLIAKLSAKEKNTLSVIIQAFVARPKRTMSQVMDDMTAYANRKGLTSDQLDDLLIGE